MKRICAFFCLALTLLVCLTAAAEETNLIANGGFETLDASGDPVDWYPVAYRTLEGYSRIAVTSEKAHSGQYSAVVENASANDARYTCTVSVEPSSLYRLSAYVLVDSMEDTGNGANLGIEDIYSYSDCLFDTDGEWQYLEWYGETGEDQHELTFGVRVGGYGAESTGKAYFDDVVLEKVDSLPTGVFASIWYDTQSYVSYDTQTSQQTGQKSTALFVALGLIFGFAYLLARPLLERGGANRRAAYAFVCLMAMALVVRIVLAVQVPGYSVDINCFTAWSLRMAERGPAGFYAEDYFCDYPPGYMLLLWPVGLLLSAVKGAGATLLVVKSLPILCDMAGAVLLFAFARKRLGDAAAALVAGLYALNPVVLVNGAAWGQADSVLALLLMLTCLEAIRRDWRAAFPLFAAAVLVKPQALLFAPVGGVWLLVCLLEKQERADRTRQWKSAGLGLGLAVLVAVAIIVPFSIRQSPGWLIRLYAETLSSYAYATLNTANLYYLIGANWTSLEAHIPTALPLVTALAAMSGGLWLLLSGETPSLRSQPRRSALGALCLLLALYQFGLTFFGGNYTAYGYGMMAFAFLLAAVCLAFDRQASHLPFYLALSLILIYVLGLKVHERYLLPALPLLLIAYVLTRDRRLLALCVGFSITTFINTAIVLDNAILFGAEMGHLNDDTLVLNDVLCVLNLLLCGFSIWVAYTGLRPSAAPQPQEAGPAVPPSYERMLLSPRDARLHLTLRDYLVMGITCVVYGVLAFTNLGSTVAPQTGWVSTSPDEQIVFDLGESTRFSLLYYAGVSYNDFSVSTSDDGVTWSAETPCRMQEGLCYRWLYALQSTQSNGEVTYMSDSPTSVVWFTGRYLRLNACEAGLNLWEIVARDENGQTLPLTIVSHTGAREGVLESEKPVENLIDEQDTCVGEPGWYNGTYFDEIYHARTAYEHLHGQAPYETTHPPLGKLLMSVGIAIFGMTPFGWRFAGALIGVLMLPALYLLALQLTHKRSVATVSMLAFSLDLMHYTQTRIATIDSFPVFFILLSYLCMVRYLQTDLFAADGEKPRLFDRCLRRSLIPLALSGLFMGLAIASKWIGLYSAVGLALLFFVAVYRQYRVSNVACGLDVERTGLDDGQKARVRAAQDFTLKRILITCGFCVIFFVLVPCVIYYLCYIPYLSPTGPVTLKRVIDAQIGMLNYHSTPGLGMDHPFQSPWWQWPFILKPMWFAQDHYEPAGYESTIMCLGNPWIFYIGAIAMLGALAACAAKYLNLRSGVSLRQGDGDLTLPVLAVGFLAQYLPWVLVPRSMYMYHYFASVPFIIMATAWWMDRLPNSRPRLRTGVMALYLVGALVFFVMFSPYASGWLTSTDWLDAMKWFSKLYY
ncbi:MAG TPA: glycosyltransferase family 39 protein [Candidatus Limiplasma pullicola]|nr:glycosyltransferase family 39 protein [Candidatus Limiplasma pullicola]